jgi:hypothetical protein
MNADGRGPGGEWKLAAGFAGGVWVLSLLFGAIARNPFGTVLLRSVLSAALAAALAVGASFLIRRFVPGIFDSAFGSDGVPAQVDEADHGIDIVVPEENPHVGESEGEGTPADDARAEPDAGDGSVSDADVDADALAAADAEPSAGEAEPEADAAEEVEGGDEIGAEPVDVEEITVDEETGEQELPDMEEEPQLAAGNQPPVLGAVGSGTVDIGGEEQDVEVVAKAVRTMMQRDERG